MTWYKCEKCGAKYYSAADQNHLVSKKCSSCGGNLLKLVQEKNNNTNGKENEIKNKYKNKVNQNVHK